MYLKELDIELLERNFTKNPGEEHPTMLALVAEEELFYVNEMIQFFNNHNIKVFGGIFPGLIYNGQYKTKGAILIPLAAVYEPVVFTDLTQTPFSLHSLFDRIESSDNLVSYIFFDGFSQDIKKFLSEIYLKLGNSVKYVGGGAGTSDYIQKPVVFTNSGIFQDASVICFTHQNARISVRHGWEIFSGPYLITSSEKNIVKTINWQNAYQAYKEALEEFKINLNASNIHKKSLKYPLGVFKEGMEYILRSPIQRTQNNELVCLGEVPENSAVYILAGDEDSLLKASEEAIRDVLKYDGNLLGSFTAIDYLRSVFLGDAFNKEVKNVYNYLTQKNPDSLNYGALTIGEIASYPSGSMDLFNKSFVIRTAYE
ncbi:MAG: FIST C-terminal domain-containing protein [Bacteroidales bacterium]|nr:FIST C-terminal domain-containing protein [Bacteroidales bacterium]MCF8338871.1 FIST C-terminal domain-containing protein [Bacteroidales bacterium]